MTTEDIEDTEKESIFHQNRTSMSSVSSVFPFYQLSPPDERCTCGHAFALDDGQDLVGRDVLDHVGPAGRPANLELINLAHSAQPEVHADVTLSKVTRSGLDFSDLGRGSSRQTESGADTVPIAAGAHRSYQQGIVLGPNFSSPV